MLHELVQQPLTPIPTENHDSFILRLVELNHPPELINLEDQAYEFAKSAHRSQIRDGEVDRNGAPLRYFEHPRSVMIALVDELREEFIKLPMRVQAVLIMGALLHDVPEDTALFGNRRTNIPGDKKSWREVVRERIDRIDPREITFEGEDPSTLDTHYEKLSVIVLGVTKLDESELRTLGILKDDPNYQESKVKLSAEMVRVAGPLAVVIKAADRLCNLRTMGNLEADRVLKKIQETEKHFMALFREFSTQEQGKMFAPLIEKLLHKIESEINHLRTRLDMSVLG